MATSKTGMAVQQGVLGDVSIYMRNGQTIVRPRHNKPGKRKATPAMLEQRAKISNLVNVWKWMKGRLRDTFEKKKANSSDYTGFMSANGRVSTACITREKAALGYAVVGPYYVSQGQLVPSIQYREKGLHTVSDIRVGDTEIRPEMMLSFFAAAVVGGNGDRFRYGDTLTFVRLVQDYKPNPLNPDDPFDELLCISPYVVQIPLLNDNTVKLSHFLPDNGSMEGLQVMDGCLATRTVACQGSAWIQTRRTPRGELLATTQRLVGEFDWYTECSKDEAVAEAVESYAEE